MISKFYYDKFFFKVKPGSDEWRAENKDRIAAEAARVMARAKAERAAENGDGAPTIVRGPPSEHGTPRQGYNERPQTAKPARRGEGSQHSQYSENQGWGAQAFDKESVASSRASGNGIKGLALRPKTAGPLRATRDAIENHEAASRDARAQQYMAQQAGGTVPKTAKYTPRYSPRHSRAPSHEGSDRGSLTQRSQNGGLGGTVEWIVKEVGLNDSQDFDRPGSARSMRSGGEGTPRSRTMVVRTPRSGVTTPRSGGAGTPRGMERPITPRVVDLEFNGVEGRTPRARSAAPSRGSNTPRSVKSARAKTPVLRPGDIQYEDGVNDVDSLLKYVVSNPNPDVDYRFDRAESEQTHRINQANMYDQPYTTRLDAPYIPPPSPDAGYDDRETTLTSWDKIQPAVSREWPNSTVHDNFLYPSQMLEPVDRTYHFRWQPERDYAEAAAKQAHMMAKPKPS